MLREPRRCWGDEESLFVGKPAASSLLNKKVSIFKAESNSESYQR
jgi:hypothetical protein